MSLVPERPRLVGRLLTGLFAAALLSWSGAASAAHFTIHDEVEGEVQLNHDANFELGVVSNGTVFPPFMSGATVAPGELATFSGGWLCNTAGSPDPGEGIIYVVDAAAPDRVKTTIYASWATTVLPGLDEASIEIVVQSSPDCEDLGLLPAAFAGLGIPGMPGSVGIPGQFRDPVTAAMVSIPSNLGMTLFPPLGPAAIGPLCATCSTCDEVHATIDGLDIDREGVRHSFHAQFDAACRAFDRGKAGTAGNVICALLHHDDAQDDKHVDPMSAQTLRDCVRDFASVNEIPLRCDE